MGGFHKGGQDLWAAEVEGLGKDTHTTVVPGGSDRNASQDSAGVGRLKVDDRRRWRVDTRPGYNDNLEHCCHRTRWNCYALGDYVLASVETEAGDERIAAGYTQVGWGPKWEQTLNTDTGNWPALTPVHATHSQVEIVRISDPGWHHIHIHHPRRHISNFHPRPMNCACENCRLSPRHLRHCSWVSFGVGVGSAGRCKDRSDSEGTAAPTWLAGAGWGSGYNILDNLSDNAPLF